MGWRNPSQVVKITKEIFHEAWEEIRTARNSRTEEAGRRMLLIF